MHYQIRVMPFELAIVPKVFTTLKAVIGYSLRFYRLHIHIHGRMVNNQVLTSSFIYALNKNTTEPASHLGPFSKLAKVSTDANSKKKNYSGALKFDKGNGVSVRRKVSVPFQRNCTISGKNMGTRVTEWKGGSWWFLSILLW